MIVSREVDQSLASACAVLQPSVVGATAVLRIGILTHNGLHHTMRCLESLREFTRVPWCAYVLDNASTDETPAYLRALADDRIAIECRSDNLGVGGGRNHLFEQLLPSMRADELLVFLDNDIEVREGWEQPFLDAFAEMPTLGVAGRWAFSMIVHDEWRDILSEHNANSSAADTVQGCCFWVRAAAARVLNGFDESLGRFWHEDDDYCVRALHAGWEVRRVRCAKIVHHEHGSGVALRPERLAGSLANQAMLVTKWRTMNAIDEHGVPRRPMPEPDMPLRLELARALGRRRPLLRTELQCAIDDATRLLHVDVTDSRAAVLASPVARVLVSQAADAASSDAATADAATSDTQVKAIAARERVTSVLESRRAASGAPMPTAGARPFSGVCNPSAWDDARWAETFETHLRDGGGRDYYARSETAWRDGQLLNALRVTGAMQSKAKLLVVGHASERVIAALSHVVSRIVVRDHDTISPEMIASMATRTFGSALLSVDVWPPSARAGAPSDRFDIVLCPNMSRYARPSDTQALLRALAAHAVTGGFVGVGASVRLSGPANGRWLERFQFADDSALAGASLRRVGRFDDSIADETLLAAVPAETTVPWRPRLARAVAPHIVSLATLVARRTEEERETQ